MTRYRLKWVAGKNTPQKVYITRVFNFGTWEEWRALKRKFHPLAIEESVKKPLAGQWTKRAKNFAEVLYSCKMPRKALISYDV
ncbi:MAG: hypothetical protein HY584_04990 [Candidatus Omnitrophica bacterium]|nr:hypothetical protein [Candidatus Omnitrophota bacterium]